MTVKELRDKLTEFPDYWEVETEGCDCIGDSFAVVACSEYYKDDRDTSNRCIITRSS